MKLGFRPLFKLLILLAITTANARFSALLAQGGLAPPGPPAPTMKTLAQIEPRTPVSALPCTIANSGSYYLTANLTGIAASNGITVTAGNVSLDLMGFTLSGVPGSADGISVVGKQANIVIRNGNLQNWGGSGVNGTNADQCRLEYLFAWHNGSNGLAAGNGSIVDHCGASSNRFNGIIVGDGSEVQNSTAAINGSRVQGLFPVGAGIVGGSSTIISDCSSFSNLYWGIVVSNNSTVTGCSASRADFYTGLGGIFAGNNCTIIDCTANENFGYGTGHGIQAGTGSLVRNCVASGNGSGIGASRSRIIDCSACVNSVGSGQGIGGGSYSIISGCLANGNTFNGIVVGSFTYISDNLVAHHMTGGILVGGSNNVIIRNLVTTNGSAPHPVQSNNTNNMIGTFETRNSMNVDKNPQANFLPQTQ